MVRLVFLEYSNINIASKEAIMDWIFPDLIDTKHKAIREKREESTGEWFLKRPEFENWVSGVGYNILYSPGQRITSMISCLYHFSWRRKNSYDVKCVQSSA